MKGIGTQRSVATISVCGYAKQEGIAQKQQTF